MGYDDEIRQPFDRGEWEQREIYAKFGLAIYFCQVLEAGLVTYLLILRRATEGETTTVDVVDRLFTELFGKTLGQNIANIKRLFGEQGKWILEEQMSAALALRNELVHRWMRDRVLQQGTSENRLAMIAELDEASAILQHADRLVTDRTQKMMAKAGMPEDFVRNELRRITELAERGEEDLDAPTYFSMRREDR
jgi:hypothetical protein